MTRKAEVPKTFLRRDGRRTRMYRPGKKRGSYLELKRCSECRELFWAARSTAVTCSTSCRSRRYRRMHRALRAAEAGQLSFIPAGTASA